MKNWWQHWSIWILAFWLISALTAAFMDFQPNQIHLDAILAKPNLIYLDLIRLDFTNLLGFDDLGRAILPRLLVGAQVSLLVVFFVTVVTSLFGISL